MSDSVCVSERSRAGAVEGIRVFVNGPQGGNPVPLVREADGMDDDTMLAIARQHGHESGFVFSSEQPDVDWAFRFFVPRHEMEMCGHATVGALWALRQSGDWRTPTARVQTRSGMVDARWDAERQRVWISQPLVSMTQLLVPLDKRVQRVLDPMGHADWEGLVVNARTSRIKTLARVGSIAQLDALTPQLSEVGGLCETIGSTGLYPYALEWRADGVPVVSARQFPKASGYPEDAATGIAAAALWGFLASTGFLPLGKPQAPAVSVVRQGEAMGRPSAIELQPRFDASGTVVGCWLSGEVVWSPL
jgi:trans-2,3-dihydro-3-hydroxyanthranilate isomerase